MSYENMELMVAGITNTIYLGTMSKKEKFPVMNSKRRDVTDIAVKAVMTHVKSMYDQSEGEKKGYKVEGVGTLAWVPHGYKITLEKVEGE